MRPSLIKWRVLEGLAGDEERSHEVGQRVPLPQPPTPQIEQPSRPADLSSLGSEHAHLAGKGTRNQHTGVEDRERDVDQVALGLPHRLGAGCRRLRVGDIPNGEVGRKQSCEEHQLRSQPNDGADSHRLWPIITTTQTRLGDRVQCALRHCHRTGNCVRVHGHEVIIAVTRAEVTPRRNFVIPSRVWHLDRSLNALSTSADASVRLLWSTGRWQRRADIRLGMCSAGS